MQAPTLKSRLALLVLLQPLVFVGLRLLAVAAHIDEHADCRSTSHTGGLTVETLLPLSCSPCAGAPS